MGETMRYSSARYFYRKIKQDPSRNWSDVYKSFWGVSLEEYIEYAIKEKLRDSYEELECHYTKK